MRNRRMQATAWGMLVLAAVALAGCASSSAQASNAEIPVASDFQTEALADGQVDRGEYQGGFTRYQACMREKGYDVVVTDDADTVMDIRIPAAGVESGADERCYIEEFNQIDDAWQLANEDSRKDNALFAACLVTNGLRCKAESAPTSRQEKIDELVSAHVDLASCLTE
jgi:hypothetical protein